MAQAPVTKRSNDWWRRGARTLIQLIAGGGLTLLFDQLAHDFSQYSAYVMILSTVLVSTAQNYCEDQGWVPAVLKGTASSGANPAPDPTPKA